MLLRAMLGILTAAAAGTAVARCRIVPPCRWCV